MPLLVLIAGLSFLGQATPDRSGEADLRRLLTWAKDLNNVHIVIFKEYREFATAPFYPDTRVDVWLARPKFRIETSGYWGDSSLTISDGSTLLSDNQSEDSPAVLADAKADLPATFAAQKLNPEDTSPFLAFLNGPTDLEKLVEKTAAIKREPDNGPDHVLSYSTKKLGNVHIVFRDERSGPVLEQIDYDTITTRTEAYKVDPIENDPPDPGTLNRQHIFVVPERVSQSMFSTKPPAGREVVDKRPKGKKPPALEMYN